MPGGCAAVVYGKIGIREMYDWIYVNLMVAITSDFTIPGAYAAIQSNGPGYDLPVPRFL